MARYGHRIADAPTRRRFIASLVLLVSCGIARMVFARWGTRLFPAYRQLSKGLMGALATIFGVVPFALWDVGALALLLLAVVTLVRRVRAGQPLLPVFSHLCLVLAVTLALFVDGWALNHYAPPLAQELDLEVRTYSVDELADATKTYLDRAAQLASQVPRKADGTLVQQDFYELARIAGSSYGELGERYEVLRGSGAPVKALLVWGEPLLYSGHTGIFWAATGEPGVPLNCPTTDLPFVMCHEAAHRLGIASEQEANFAAYLACESSDDLRFCYAGAYSAFGYCFNALWSADAETARQLLEEATTGERGEGVRLLWADRVATRAHYDAYEGTFKKVGTAVNDGYLKGFGEQAGVRSYGLVVDYLIAWQQAGQ